MKKINQVISVGLLAITCAGSSGWCEGGSNGSGGDIVKFLNGTSGVADVFLDIEGQQPNGLPPMRRLKGRLYHAIGQAVKILKDFDRGDSLSPCSDSSYSDRKCKDVNPVYRVLDELATNPKNLRIFVVQTAEEMADYCASGGKKSYKLPAGVTVSKAACTSGSDTFLVEPVFNELPLQDQAYLMMHERLTTIRDNLGGRNYQAIAGVIGGLKTAIQIAKRQLDGDRQPLPPNEVKLLNAMYVGLAELQDMDSAYAGTNARALNWEVTPNGGAKISPEVKVVDGAYADIFTRIGAPAKLCPRTGCLIKAGTQISYSDIVLYRDFIAGGQILSDITVNAKSPTYYYDFETEKSDPVVKWNWIYRDDNNVYLNISDKDEYYYLTSDRLTVSITGAKVDSLCNIKKKSGGLFGYSYRYATSCSITLTGMVPSDASLRGIDAAGVIQKLGLLKLFSSSISEEWWRASLTKLPLPAPLTKEGDWSYTILYANK